MNEDEIKEKLMNLHKTIMEKNVDKILEFFDEDAEIKTNEGTFKGEKDIKKYWKWLSKQFSEPQLEEIGIFVKGNKAAHEYILKGEVEEEKEFEVPGVAISKFSDDKIKELNIYYDRLLLAKQGSEGWLGKKMVNSIIGRMEEGLTK